MGGGVLTCTMPNGPVRPSRLVLWVKRVMELVASCKPGTEGIMTRQPKELQHGHEQPPLSGLNLNTLLSTFNSQQQLSFHYFKYWISPAHPTHLQHDSELPAGEGDGLSQVLGLLQVHLHTHSNRRSSTVRQQAGDARSGRVWELPFLLPPPPLPPPPNP